MTNYCPLVIGRCWLGRLTCKIVPILPIWFGGMLNPTQSVSDCMTSNDNLVKRLHACLLCGDDSACAVVVYSLSQHVHRVPSF